jgi:hypothetical protein
MGIIDKTTYTLSCHECETNESASVLDHGSGWSGSSWQSGAKFAGFQTQWNGGGKQEPELLSATCNACGKPAKVASR